MEQQSEETGSGRPGPHVKPGRLWNEPTLAIAPEPWDKHRARRLDPAKVLRLRGQTPPRPTLYAGDTLLLRGLVADDSSLKVLREVAASLKLRLVDDGEVGAEAELLDRADLPEHVKNDLRARWVSVVHFEPDTDEPAMPPDAWEVLQNLRARRKSPSALVAGVALEHVVSSSGPGIGGNPFTNSHGIGGNPFTNSHGAGALAGYGLAGLGGRQPVNWVGQPPANRYPLDGATVRRPLVAVLDSGVVQRPWLGPAFVGPRPADLGPPLGLPPEPAARPGACGTRPPGATPNPHPIATAPRPGGGTWTVLRPPPCRHFRCTGLSSVTPPIRGCKMCAPRPAWLAVIMSMQPGVPGACPDRKP